MWVWCVIWVLNRGMVDLVGPVGPVGPVGLVGPVVLESLVDLVVFFGSGGSRH